MHCLVLSADFPNRLEPWRGPYHRYQIGSLARHCRVTVVAPLPWPRLLRTPTLSALMGLGERFLDGITTYHPLFRYVPVVGRRFLWRGVVSAVERTYEFQDPAVYDVILATFAYPHGYAAMKLAERLDLPYVVKVRGTDLHGLPERGWRRRSTGEALRNAAAVVAVSPNLVEMATRLGADADKVHLLMNGVDASRFTSVPRTEARGSLGVPAEKRVVLFVGRFVRVKGIDLLLDALHRCTGSGRGVDWQLVLAGDGPLQERVTAQADRHGISDRVRLAGRVPPDEVARWMNAADLLVLPSRDEGCPNVVLEALACGTPVVASRVGAVPELLDESCGIVVGPEDPAALGEAISRALRRRWDRSAIRRRVAGMSWTRNAQRLHDILHRARREVPCAEEAE